MFNKKGQGMVVFWLMGFCMIVLVLAMVAVYVQDTGAAQYVSNLPAGVQQVYGLVVAIAGPIVNGLYLLVAPVGQPENVQMIAFAMFLLFLLVGTVSLNSFFRTPMSLLISAIIGLIAARALTATIIEKSALAASPLSAISFLVGVFPILAISGGLRRLGVTKMTKFIAYLVAAALYLFFFVVVFQSWTLGIVYAIAIVLMGFGEVIFPILRRARNGHFWEDVGREVVRVEVIQTRAQQMAQSAARARARGP